MKSKTRKLVLNSILLAMGLLLHQITPALGLSIQPDMALSMLFTIMILNKNDYKSCLTAGIVTGVFTALTTKFPGGQIPNVIDKVITVNIIYIVMFIVYSLSFVKKMNTKKQDALVITIILLVGTFISGCTFLLSAQLLVGLPGSFFALFMIAVAPAIIINLIAGIFLFKIVNLSINRGVVKA
ncbi:MAG: tryptophan transporter [Peptostreptococcaceae bacterium]